MCHLHVETKLKASEKKQNLLSYFFGGMSPIAFICASAHIAIHIST